jgi:hypothetical protein
MAGGVKRLSGWSAGVMASGKPVAGPHPVLQVPVGLSRQASSEGAGAVGLDGVLEPGGRGAPAGPRGWAQTRYGTREAERGRHRTGVTREWGSRHWWVGELDVGFVFFTGLLVNWALGCLTEQEPIVSVPVLSVSVPDSFGSVPSSWFFVSNLIGT